MTIGLKAAVAGIAAALVAMAGWAGAEPSAALRTLQPGQWQLKEVGAAEGRSLCVADPATLLQLGHGDAKCNRTVIESDASALTATYSCPGAGNGRSTLTVRTPTTFRLQTQGLAGGAPFEFDYEAKRTGDCAGAGEPGTH